MQVVDEQVARLRQHAAVLHGDAVDEMTLSWLPVVLGRGTRLFENSLPGSAWQLAGSRPFLSGMVQARYRRRPTTSS